MIRKLIYKIFFIEIMQGLALTLSRLFSRAVTRQYPTEPRPSLPGFRGLHALVLNPDGTPKCMHCGACQAICPPRCIKLSITKDDEGKPLKNYDLDVLRCIFCGLCVESCPYEAIVLTEHYEYSAYSREPFLFNKVQLTANWEKFMSVDKTEYYFKHFWSPKSEDFTEHDNQAVFDKVRFEQKRAAGSLFK